MGDEAPVLGEAPVLDEAPALDEALGAWLALLGKKLNELETHQSKLATYLDERRGYWNHRRHGEVGLHYLDERRGFPSYQHAYNYLDERRGFPSYQHAYNYLDERRGFP